MTFITLVSSDFTSTRVKLCVTIIRSSAVKISTLKPMNYILGAQNTFVVIEGLVYGSLGPLKELEKTTTLSSQLSTAMQIL